METVASASSIVSIILLLASSAINIFISMKLSKLENQIRESVYEAIDKATATLRTERKEGADILRREFQREIDKLEQRINNKL